MASKTTENMDDICAVCSENIDIFAVGLCDHHICLKCSTRMRVLCEQMYCPICRADIPKVFFIKKLHKFHSIDTRFFPVNRKYKIYFENDKIQCEFYRLLDYRCNNCDTNTPMRTFTQLETHMKREHSLFYCDICVHHLKIFSHERKTYDRAGLATHRRIGDPDDRSHKGHPLCEFCDERYLDKDELLRHLRRDHYFCHFCDADGSNQYYKNYDLLREHFAESHFLCEEGDCYNVQFTNAFRTEIDLKAHTASEHGKTLNKAKARQARTLDIEVNLVPRIGGRDHRRDRARGGVTGADYQDYKQDSRPNSGRSQANSYGRGRSARAIEREQIETAHAISASLAEAERQTGAVSVVAAELIRPNTPQNQNNNEKFEERVEDFPTLDGRHVTMDASDESESRHKSSLAKQVAYANNMSVQGAGGMKEEEFPALGGGFAKPPPVKQSQKEEDFRSLGGGFAKPPPLKQSRVWSAPVATNKSNSYHRDKPNKNSASKPPVFHSKPIHVVETSNLNDYPTLRGGSTTTAPSDIRPKIPGLNFVPEQSSPKQSPKSIRKDNKPKVKINSSLPSREKDFPAMDAPKQSIKQEIQKESTSNTARSSYYTKPGKKSTLSQISQSFSDTFSQSNQKSLSSSSSKKEFESAKSSKSLKKEPSKPFTQQVENKPVNSSTTNYDISETDFPNLASKSKSKTSAKEDNQSSLGKSKPNKSSKKSNNNSGKTTPEFENISSNAALNVKSSSSISNAKIGKDEDFPSLGGSGKSSKSWVGESNIKQISSKSKLAKEEDFGEFKSPPVPKKTSAVNESDFPSLGGKPAKNTQLNTNWAPKTKYTEDAVNEKQEDFVKIKPKGKKKKVPTATLR